MSILRVDEMRPLFQEAIVTKLLSSSDCKTRVTNFSFDQIPMGSALLRQLLIFLRPFPHGVPYYDQGANFPTKFEQRSHTKVTISRVFLMEFGEKEVC